MENLSLIGKGSWIGMTEVNRIILDNLEKLETERIKLTNQGKKDIKLSWMNGSVGFNFKNEGEFVDSFKNFTPVCSAK